MMVLSSSTLARWWWRYSVLLVVLLPQLAQGDDATSNSNAYKNGKYVFSVCADTIIYVEDISILCDSPGTYYYGSNKYRNSAECRPGDKAKLQIAFEILQDLSDYNAANNANNGNANNANGDGDDAYVTLLVQGYGSVKSVELYSSASLCSDISSLQVVSNASQACPGAGYYSISESFYWSEKNDNYDYSFFPKVTIGFASPQYRYKQVYDLGGANTNQCSSGKTIQGWTELVRRSAANTLKTFFLTFGFLLLSVSALICAGLCIFRQAHIETKELIVDDPVDETDYQKYTAVGDPNSDIVTDF